MPLDKSGSQASVSKNISELVHHGKKKRSMRQIVAIALSVKRKANGKK